jgi:tetratricopeptide (TPR) repeat protein
MSRLATFCLGLLLGVPAVFADARTDCYDKRGEAAIRACTEAILRDPKDAVSYVNRAYEFLQKADYPRALADYTRAIEIDPARWDAFQGRAWASFKMNKAADGLPDAERSLALKPGDARTLDIRGHILEALGRREEAVADFRRALSIEPRMRGSRDGLKRLGAAP